MAAHWTIESISKLLSVLPIPVYPLPDDNTAHFLSSRSISVGTTWAAEIQRAPLTKTEQFLKRCFDAVGAGAVLLLLSPLMLMTALLIKFDSPDQFCRPATVLTAAPGAVRIFSAGAANADFELRACQRSVKSRKPDTLYFIRVGRKAALDYCVPQRVKRERRADRQPAESLCKWA